MTLLRLLSFTAPSSPASSTSTFYLVDPYNIILCSSLAVLNEKRSPLEFSDLLISRSNSNPYLCVTSKDYLVYLILSPEPPTSPTSSILLSYDAFKTFLQTNPIKQLTIVLRGSVSAINANNGRSYNTDPYAVCSTLAGSCFAILPLMKYDQNDGRVQPPILSADFLQCVCNPSSGGGEKINGDGNNRERRKSSLTQSIKNIFRRDSSGVLDSNRQSNVDKAKKIKVRHAIAIAMFRKLCSEHTLIP